MSNYQLLDWDSKILGVSTAKILPERLNPSELAGTLKDLADQKVNLVFWASDKDDLASQEAAHEFSGFLADRKVTYHMDLTGFSADDINLQQIESYKELLPTTELYQLALEIGIKSRFGVDPRIPREKMAQVYHTWMDNSTKRQIAKEVLVIKKQGKIVGMTTLGEKNNRGDIGLLAVAPDCRGMQLGQLLVKASQNWCVKNGYRWSQVVTQQDNQPACKLYEKCGYVIDKVEHFYHFWL